MRLVVRRGLVLGLVLLAAGCSGGRPAPGPSPYPSISPPPASIAPVERVTDLRLPIEAYALTPEQAQTVYDAATKVVNDCMASFGLAADRKPPVIPPATLTDHRYGVTDPADAARYGYHPAPGEDRNDARPGPEPAGPAAEQSVYRGTVARYDGREVPAGGCQGEGRRRSGLDAIDQADPGSVVNRISVDSMPASEADPRVRTVLKKWSSCMRAAGFRYDSPVGMADHDPELAASFEADTASAAEIRLAVADVACKTKADVVSTWFAVESAYEQVMIEQNAAVLSRVRDANQQAGQKSTAILSAK